MKKNYKIYSLPGCEVIPQMKQLCLYMFFAISSLLRIPNLIPDECSVIIVPFRDSSLHGT